MARDAQSEQPAQGGPTVAAQDVFEDQREVDPQAVPAVEVLRTVVTLGCATIDESLIGQALPASAVIRPHGVELTICHAGSLELALPAASVPESDAPSASSVPMSLDELRELVWLMGPARRPRSAIVGRALHDLRAVSETTAKINVDICDRIAKVGSHHLRNEIVEALDRLRNTVNSSGATRDLANLLEKAVNYLGDRGWIALRAVNLGGGAYLQGDGINLFDGFPAWGCRDEEPPKLFRPRGRSAASTVEGLVADSPANQPGNTPPVDAPP